MRLLLWVDDLETTWREAQNGGCSSDLWRELARRREREHPEDALAVYRSLLEPVLAAVRATHRRKRNFMRMLDAFD